ncbi:MAG: hypothetical protein ACR2RF_19385 [Geminicoccaceae bacterium]
MRIELSVAGSSTNSQCDRLLHSVLSRLAKIGFTELPPTEPTTLSVFNQGPLIEGDAEVLFGPFRSTRMEEGRDHQALGLYLVRLVAEHYGGVGKLANRPDGDGVEASISLPLASTADPPLQATGNRARARP